MPYIKQEIRPGIDVVIDRVALDNEGELNYAITKLIHNYILDRKINYSLLNSVMGVITCVGKEFYIRVVIPYEDHKRNENGKVSSLD